MKINIPQNIKNSKFFKPLTTVIMITNIILGTGPIIIPPVFLLGGIGLSTIFILIIALLSYIACEFIVESISLCNALTYIKNKSQDAILTTANENMITDIEQQEGDNKQKKINVTINNINKNQTNKNNKNQELSTADSLSSKVLSNENLDQCDAIAEEQNEESKDSNQNTSNSNESDSNKNNKIDILSSKTNNSSENLSQKSQNSGKLVIEIKEKKNKQQQEDIFSIRQNFEFQEIGQMIFGKKGKHIAATLICMYLFGVIISKYIITAQTMAGVFEGVNYIGTYSFWLGLFFILCAIQSFKNMSDIQWVQKLIGFVRLVTVILFICAPIYIIISTGKSYPLTNFSHTYDNNQTFQYEAFNFDAFSNLFSNFIFSFLFHHSLGSIVSNTKPEQSIKKVIGVVYIISTIVSLAIPIIAIFAFGGNLTDPYDNESILYYNNMFKESLAWVYYFTSFYIFLNVASLPVVTIVLKNNLLKWITPQNQNNKKYSIVSTSLVLLIILVSAILFQNQIQTVISIIAGLCGVLIMMFLPSIFVIKGRNMVQQQLKDSKFSQEQQINQHKSIIGNKCLPYFLSILSIVIFTYNVFLITNKFTN